MSHDHAQDGVGARDHRIVGSGIRPWLIGALAVSLLTIVAWLIAYLALVDIWHAREPNLEAEWWTAKIALGLLAVCVSLTVPVLIVASRKQLVSHIWLILALAASATVVAYLDLRAFDTIESTTSQASAGSWRVVSIGFIPIGLFLISAVSTIAGAIRRASFLRFSDELRSQDRVGSTEE